MQAPPGTAITAARAARTSAVCWGAILAGSAVLAAMSLLLFALLSGLELAMLASTSARGGPATAAAVALIAAQCISACLGGYITGRLRRRWVGTHSHEVLVRDTAHGFITWSVATLVLATGVASAACGFLGGSVPVGSAVSTVPGLRFIEAARAGQLTAPRSDLVLPEGPAEPGVIELYRAAPATLTPSGSGFANNGQALLADPARYGSRYGSMERRDAATTSVITALSMLIGALSASVSAALGGRLRDRHP
jgi:hypothetical protein